jgi:hypothetical protein
MLLAGIEIDDSHVLGLAARLRNHGFDHTASALERHFDANGAEFALTRGEREQVLLCLENGSDEQLAQLRATLLQDGHF